MGMFNYVEFSEKCPTCGGVLDNFQSKSDEVLDLRTVKPWEVMEFHTNCGNCMTRIDYVRGDAKEPVCESNFLEHFEKYVETRRLHEPRQKMWPPGW